MKRASWLRKALWITPFVLLVLLAAGIVVLRSYLSSQRATQQVAERLQDMLGGRVEVQGAQIGLIGDSSVRGIQAYEEGEQNKPWLRIDDVMADVSVLSLLRDQSPDDVHLQGAHVRLRFDSNGHLLTKLPAKKKGAPARLPRLHLEGGELTFDQQHRSPMIIRGVNADLVSGDNGLKLTGTVSDPFWGDWKAHGDFNSAGSKGSITLDTDKVAVTMPKLKAIAFVPPSVWQEIHVEGTVRVQARFDMETSGEDTSLHYRMEIAPRDALVRVPSINLESTQVNGRAIVVDEIVEVDNAHGKTADGSITASGKMNFHDEPTHLALKASVQDVVLHDLPASWKVPPNIDGKLTGSADLVVTLKQGKIETAGSGEGVIREAKWSGIAIKNPVRLAMRSNGRRFQFHQPGPVPLAAGKAAQAPVRAAPDLVARRDPAPQESKSKSADVARRDPVPEKSKPAGNDDFLSNAPAEMVNLLGRGIQMTADGLAQGIDAAAQALGKLKPPSKPGEVPTYLDVDLNLQDVDVAQLVKKLGLDLPYAVTGRLTFQVHASIPVNTAGDLKAYRLNGTAKLPSFSMAGLAMANVEAKVRYLDGVLDLENLRGQMPASNDRKTTGKFAGNARVQVVPRGDLQATLELVRIPLDSVLSLVPQAKNQAAGVVSGKVQARAPLEKLGDPSTWRGSANLNSPSLTVYGLPLSNASVGLIVDEARARLTTLKADMEGTPLTGEGELQFTIAYPFKAEVHLGRTDLTALNRLSPSFRPPLRIKGRAQLNGSVTGTLKPFQFDTSGQVQARDLVAEGFKVDDLSFRWSKDKNGLKLDAIKADLYGGGVTGWARVPLSAAAAGTANLTVRHLDVQAAAKSLPSFPVRLEGKISGTVKGELAAAEGGRPRTWTTDVELTAPQLRVQGIPAEKLKGAIDSRAGKTSYNLQGETLGGTFTLKGDLPTPVKEKEKKKSEEPVGQSGPELLRLGAVEVAARQPAPDEPAGQGRFVLRDARLSRLWDAYNISGGLTHLDGQFSLTVDYRNTGTDFFPVGSGTFSIVNIRLDDDYLADSLQGNVRLTANDLQLDNISGDVAGGQLRGRFVFGLKANSRGYYHLELQQVQASRLLLLLPAVAAHVKGSVDMDLRGRIGPEWNGDGGATLVRGQVYGMDITEWRIPLTFTFSPAQGTGELTVRDSKASLAQGRASFESKLNWGNGLRLSGLLLFYRVDLRTLLRHSPAVSAYVSGRVSGRVDLAGSEMRSLNDLTAVVQAKMEQGQALQLPVLQQITPFLRPGVSSSTFQSGALKGRLAGGLFRIQRATLVGNFLKLLILGTVNLAGNLNLEVTAQTGLNALNSARTNGLSSRIPLLGAIPRLLLYEASSLLSLAVVHMRVTGTVGSPVVRVEPLLLMTEESIRFFFGRAIGLDIPNLP